MSTNLVLLDSTFELHAGWYVDVAIGTVLPAIP